MTQTLSPSDTGEILAPDLARPYVPHAPYVNLNLADTHVLRYSPGSWVPRPDPTDPDLHCMTAEEVDLAVQVREAADADAYPEEAPVLLADVMPLPRGRRRGRGRAPGLPEWLLITLCGLAGAAGGAAVLTVAVIQAVTR